MNFYWLIELVPAISNHPPFQPTYYAGWLETPIDAAKTQDVHASPKFTRKDDAQRVVDELKGCHTLSCVWKVVEHGFENDIHYGLKMRVFDAELDLWIPTADVLAGRYDDRIEHLKLGIHPPKFGREAVEVLRRSHSAGDSQ